jgi:hypothetical protein
VADTHAERVPPRPRRHRPATRSRVVLGMFGGQSKRFRERAGLDRPGLGSRTGYSPATIAAWRQSRHSLARMPTSCFCRAASSSGVQSSCWSTWLVSAKGTTPLRPVKYLTFFAAKS